MNNTKYKFNKYIYKLKHTDLQNKSDLYIQKLKYYFSLIQTGGGTEEQQMLVKHDLNLLEAHNKTIAKLEIEKKNVNDKLISLATKIKDINKFHSDVTKKDATLKKEHSSVINKLRPLQQKVIELSKQEETLTKRYQKNVYHAEEIHKLLLEKAKEKVFLKDTLEKIKEDLDRNKRTKKDLVTSIQKQIKIIKM